MFPHFRGMSIGEGSCALQYIFFRDNSRFSAQEETKICISGIIYIHKFIDPLYSIKYCLTFIIRKKQSPVLCGTPPTSVIFSDASFALGMGMVRGVATLMHDNERGKWNIDINKFQHSNAFQSATINIHAIL